MIYRQAVHDRLDSYIINYRGYMSELYRDSGIWSEDIILERYFSESEKRKEDILDTIEIRLSQDSVIGHSGHGTVKIPWRTKYLIITFEDMEDERVILDLEIV